MKKSNIIFISYIDNCSRKVKIFKSTKEMNSWIVSKSLAVQFERELFEVDLILEGDIQVTYNSMGDIE